MRVQANTRSSSSSSIPPYPKQSERPKRLSTRRIPSSSCRRSRARPSSRLFCIGTSETVGGSGKWVRNRAGDRLRRRSPISGTPLERLAQEEGFRRVFDPSFGRRWALLGAVAFRTAPGGTCGGRHTVVARSRREYGKPVFHGYFCGGEPRCVARRSNGRPRKGRKGQADPHRFAFSRPFRNVARPAYRRKHRQGRHGHRSHRQ